MDKQRTPAAEILHGPVRYISNIPLKTTGTSRRPQLQEEKKSIIQTNFKQSTCQPIQTIHLNIFPAFKYISSRKLQLQEGKQSTIWTSFNFGSSFRDPEDEQQNQRAEDHQSSLIQHRFKEENSAHLDLKNLNPSFRKLCTQDLIRKVILRNLANSDLVSPLSLRPSQNSKYSRQCRKTLVRAEDTYQGCRKK